MSFKSLRRLTIAMDNSNQYSQNILDKFRLISHTDVKTGDASNGRQACDKPCSDNQSNKRKHEEDDESFVGLSEPDVGIKQYVSNLEGCSGVMKHRFSDFVVNEIDPFGNVVELTSFDVPVEVEEELENFESAVSEDDWNKIDEMLCSERKAIGSVMIDVTDKSKDERTFIHLSIKKKYGPRVVSNTHDGEDKKYVEVKRKTSKADSYRDWPKGRGEYLHCYMFKKNKDTTELVHLLSERLRIKNSMVGFAGTKDKRGNTTQRMSFRRRTAENLLALKIRNVYFGNFSYQSEQIRLGQNKGNQFQIALRNISPNVDVDASLESLKENGFINYFGLQRFGNNVDVPTFAVGKALLASNWKGAIELILKPKPNSKRRKELILAQQSWYRDRDPAAAVKWISKNDTSLEAKILRALKMQGKNSFLNSLMALPRNTMTMYLHSYQSIVWNRIVSKRIEKFGLKPLAGDLVVCEGDLEEMFEDRVDFEQGSQEEEVQDSPKENPSSEEKSYTIKRNLAREITQDEVNTTSIFDVVYPLPGHDIKFPNNEVKSWYEEILAEDNFNLDSFNNIHKHFALSGAYRRFLSKPKDLSWKVVSYNDVNQDFILSDVDKIHNIKLNDPMEDGQHKALIVSFKLDACSYATMALREIMKCDTSAHHQAKLIKQISNAESVSSKKIKT